MLVQPRRHQLGMVLGDVVQVVGDAAAHVVAGVVLQRPQQRQGGRRVIDQRLQLQAPRQARPRALADQPPHMLAGVVDPACQRGERELRVPQHERAQRPLGGEALRDGVQRLQRALRVIEAAAGDKLAGRPQRPARQPGCAIDEVVAARRQRSGGASAASIQPAAMSKSSGRVACSASHSCSARAFSSSACRPGSAERAETARPEMPAPRATAAWRSPAPCPG